MQGFRIQQWGQDPVWEEMPAPRPGPGEVLVEVEACGVGLTVLNCIDGNLTNNPGLLPRVPGHEFVGRVCELGEGADPSLLGSRVAAYFYLYCGGCDQCRAGHPSRCRSLAGHLGVHHDGGYAPWATLPARNAIPIPETIDPVAATVIPDAVATPVHVCRNRARVEPGDRVVVIGAGGGVGIHMVQMAKICGAQVAGIEQTQSKLEALAELGVIALGCGPTLDLDPARIFASSLPTVIIDMVGQQATLEWALRSVDPGGRVVLVTTFPGRTITLSPRETVFRELSIIGSRYCSPAEMSEAAALVATGDIRPILGSVCRPQGVLHLHAQLRQGTLLGRGALDWRAAH